jgi:hypothetical protein
LPSFFCAGLRLFETALGALSHHSMRLRFRTAFNYFIENFVKFREVYPVPEIAGKLWLEIVTHRPQSGFCSFLLVSAPKIIPDASSAAFPAIGPCIPLILSSVIGHELYPDIAEKLLAMIPHLDTDPPSVVLSKLAMTIIGVRVRRMPREVGKPFVTEWFRGWIKMIGRPVTVTTSRS